MKPDRSSRSTSSPPDRINSSTKDAKKGPTNTGNSSSRSNNEANDDGSRDFDYIMFSDDPGQPDRNNDDVSPAFTSALNQDDNNTTTAANTVTTTTTRRSVSSVPIEKQLSPFDATIHLLKGNLGPGCLNLPAAFALTGCVLGSGLFLLVACQGIYTMWLLVECKTMLADKYDRELLNLHQQQPRGGGLDPLSVDNQEHDHQQSSMVLTTQDATRVPSQLTTTSLSTSATTGAVSIVSNAAPQWTFMTCARVSLGSAGGRVVEILLFVVQTGVCCVFVSLLSTNLEAAVPSLGSVAAVCCVTIVLLFMVLLRFIKDLLWLSATANLCMIIAIFTSTLAGTIVAIIRHQDNLQQQQLYESNIENGIGNADGDNPGSASTEVSYFNPSIAAIVTFMADLFYAFEGIGLVLPIENSFGGISGGASRAGSSAVPSSSPFQPVLIRSMTIVAILFMCIGIAGSVGFPDIRSGSVTAYLELQYPDVLWFSVVNYLVILAVALTFPLQLTPAMEVLENWLSGGCRCCWRSNRRELELVPTEDHDINHESHDGLHNGVQSKSGPGDSLDHGYETKSGTVMAVSPSPLSGNAVDTFNDEELQRTNGMVDSTSNYCGAHEWILRRWAMVFLCSGIVLLVKNNLGVLMAFFGAVGQTGLAGMPCVVHLSLQRQGIAPPNRWKSILDVGIISFCFLVMIAGVIESVRDIMED